MDYKELIAELRTAVSLEDTTYYERERYLDAATAIETLFAELDAAVEELRGQCTHCKHTRVCALDKQHMVGCVTTNKGNWEWRGPQKGD